MSAKNTHKLSLAACAPAASFGAPAALKGGVLNQQGILINQGFITMKKIMIVGAIACMLLASGAEAAITDIDGQAGGGLVPWALLSSGPTVAITHISTQNLGINGIAVNTSFADRVEVSYAHNMLDIAGSPLAAGNGPLSGGNNADAVDNFGLKVKLNDMSDSMPQFALGLLYKQASGDLVSNVLNPGLGLSDSSTDLYGAVSKMLNLGGKNVLLNGVLRATKANQFGLLGFGGGTSVGANSNYSIVPEVSAEVFAASNVVFGAEYRGEPNNSVAATDAVLHQNSEYDIHVVYVANKNFTLTAAYLNLGKVAPGVTGTTSSQNGMLLQAQVNF
ncbi:MAG: DUF3034 family protein [Sulfuriferula sp.]